MIANNLNQSTAAMTSTVLWSSKPSAELLAMLVGYSAQIFADFAGYTLIAIGLGRLFGYELPINFHRPYFAESFSEFWRRWHISLSSWLRDYLYIPLGGNRRGRVRTYLNLGIVMFLGGLWHGPEWKYALWGMAHGPALSTERLAGEWAERKGWRLRSRGAGHPPPSRRLRVCVCNYRLVAVPHALAQRCHFVPRGNNPLAQFPATLHNCQPANTHPPFYPGARSPLPELLAGKEPRSAAGARAGTGILRKSVGLGMGCRRKRNCLYLFPVLGRGRLSRADGGPRPTEIWPSRARAAQSASLPGFFSPWLW